MNSVGNTLTNVKDGVVIEDKKGNQFVWIPAKTGSGVTIHTSIGDKTIIYQRTDFGKQSAGTYNNFSETLPTDEEASVNANGGYYIGRFEAGDKVSTEAKKMRENGDSQSNEVSIKKGQAPYNYISYDNLKSLAEGMNAAQNYTTATTKLVGSYAWDTALNYICQTNEEGYMLATTTDSTYGNIGTGTDISNKTLTGAYEADNYSNIHDILGNCYEWTTEFYSNSNYPSVSRGGGYYVSSSYAANHNFATTTNSTSTDSFRLQLYIK